MIASDQETLVVHAAADGVISVSQGAAMVRDRAVAVRNDVLAESIRTRKTPPASEVHVTFCTEKGKAAIEHLAGYFGL